MRNKNRTLYLNNSGSKWVTFDNEGRHDTITLQTKNGVEVIRRVNFWQSFGNHATANISYKGKKLDVFADTVLDD
ncbi:MAG: hypothetical protein WC679_01835 [Bacteroidales bacterium]|jgi:hypothetical protein